MTILAVDIGNTKTKIATVKTNRILTVDTVSNKGVNTANLFWERWTQVIEEDVLKNSEVAIASVVPGLDEIVIEMSSKLNRKPWFLSSPWDSSFLKIESSDRGGIGADRIAGATALYEQYGAGIAVDFGTATTVEAVGPAGVYHGGVIMPGLRASLVGLSEVTARLPRLKPEKPVEFSCADTSEALQSGMFYGLAGAVDRAVQELRQKFELDNKTVVVATGGRAGDFKHICNSIDELDPNLVLKGLVRCYKNNKITKNNLDIDEI